MILSELSVCVLVPDSAFMSMCCNLHALMPLPGLCVAWLMPLMPLPGLRMVELTSLRPPPGFVCHNDHVPVTISGASRVVVLMPLMRLPALKECMWVFLMVHSGHNVCVLVPGATYISTCCDVHALMPLPGLCVALFRPLMPLPGLRVV